ncbi:MAG TPA: SusC/RagA family TonB-linked outer membrane protein [Niabella sp.]|nr:SusC/RagA family TonB-linked outer membrane protein [Niabella sp.]
MKLVLIIGMFFFVFSLNAQTNKIVGRIINESGQGLPSISVTIKGTQNIYITDSLGYFAINGISDSTTVIITGIGFDPLEYRVYPRNDEFRIKLKSASKQLDEVEIISSGYENIPKERAVGSFVKIENSTLNQQAGTNILDRLDGVTSGLIFNKTKQNGNPQNKTAITIRGLSTINAGLDPLIVLDGFIYEGNIDNINPNDIENVTVLKDAASTSIWGARAGNGVIIISTKAGRLNQKMQINIASNVIISTKPDLFYQPQMSSSDLINFEETLFNNGYFDDRINWEPYLSLTPAVEIFQNRKTGLVTPQDAAKQIDSLKNIDTRNEFKKHFLTNPIIQQYSIGINGGGQSNVYSAFVAFDKVVGETFNKQNKINVKIEDHFSPTKGLLINLGAYYTNTQSHSGRNLLYSNSIIQGGRQTPYIKFVDDKGNPARFSTDFNNQFLDTLGGGKLLDWAYYPLEDYKHEITTTKLNEIYANMGISYTILKGFTLDLKYQYQYQQSENNQINDAESFTARNLINSFTQVDYSTGTVSHNIPIGGIRTYGFLSTESSTLRGQLNYNHRWNRNELSLIAGSEIRQLTEKSNFNTLYGYNDDPLTYSNIDPINYYPTMMFGIYQQIPLSISSSEYLNRFVSLYSNVSYTHRNKYTISGSIRKDGSNIFGAGTNDKWKPLWSIGGLWKFSDESFYSARLFPTLRIRASYGFSGNVDLSKSSVAVGTYFQGSSPTFLPYTRINTLNNPELSWEKIGQLNIGIDFALKNNLISGSVDFYSKEGTNLYGNAPYDYTAWGFTNTIIRNVAATKSTGMDIIVNTNNINKAFQWKTTLISNYNKQRVTKYETQASMQINSILGGGQSIIPVIGKPPYSIAAYKWAGLDQHGNPQGFLNAQQSTDYRAIFNEGREKGIEGNIIYIGSAVPTVFGSIINTFSWKKIMLAINVSYKLGYYFRRPSLSYSDLIYSGNGNSEYTHRWQKPGDELITTVPSFIFPNNDERDNFYRLSEINVLKADHIRLQYLTFNYSLQNLLWKKAGLKEFQIYANLSNLGILWKSANTNLDPDYPFTITPLKSYTFGLRINL